MVNYSGTDSDRDNTPPIGGRQVATQRTTRTGKMLTEEQLAALQSVFPPPYSVNGNTSEIEAGFMLGVAAVMQRLREGV